MRRVLALQRGLDCVLGLDSLADGYLGFWFLGEI